AKPPAFLTLAIYYRTTCIHCAAVFTPLVDVSMTFAPAVGFETWIALLPLASVTGAPARLACARCASGWIILSSGETRYQLGFTFHAGAVTLTSSAATAH